MQCRDRDAETRRAFRDIWIANRRDEKSLRAECARKLDRILFVTDDERVNRAAVHGCAWIWDAVFGQAHAQRFDPTPEREATLLAGF